MILLLIVSLWLWLKSLFQCKSMGAYIQLLKVFSRQQLCSGLSIAFRKSRATYSANKRKRNRAVYSCSRPLYTRCCRFMHTHTCNGLSQSWKMCNSVSDVNNLSNARKILVNRSMKTRTARWPELSPGLQHVMKWSWGGRKTQKTKRSLHICARLQTITHLKPPGHVMYPLSLFIIACSHNHMLCSSWHFIEYWVPVMI